MNNDTVLRLSDVRKFCRPQPQLRVCLQADGSVYQAQESTKDLDVFLAFRTLEGQRQFSFDSAIRESVEIHVVPLTFGEIALQCVTSKDTLVAIDPWHEDELAFDDCLIIYFTPTQKL